MQQQQYRALVVDDEPAVRMITMRELSRTGFTCDAARDGLHAKELLADSRYDAVVTDLRMPEMNGHALAVDLLTLPSRPVVVVLTGVTEPRLAKDLIARGVDDILFKPIDQSILASKVRALVERRAALAVSSKRDRQDAGSESVDASGRQPVAPMELTTSDVDAGLAGIAELSPLSQAALDVVKMTAIDTFQTRQLTAAIELDGALAAELLRIANSCHYNAAGRAATGVDEAVVRIGQKRTGELALGMSANAALKTESLSWLDRSLLWRRSLAAGVAVDLLVNKGGHSAIGAGLYLSALMHPLGRVALSNLYPDRYHAMLQRSQRTGEALRLGEQRVFGRSQAEGMATLLEAWNVPPDVFEPLKYLASPQSIVSHLAEPLRMRVELLRLAVLIARLAIGQWDAWDLVQFPGQDMLQSLQAESVSDLIEQTRIELEAMGESGDFEATRALRATKDNAGASESRELPYCNLAAEPFDFFGEFLPSAGVSPRRCLPAELHQDRAAIINCCGMTTQEVMRASVCSLRHVLVSDAENVSQLPISGRLLAIPASFGSIRSFLATMAESNAD